MMAFLISTALRLLVVALGGASVAKRGRDVNCACYIAGVGASSGFLEPFSGWWHKKGMDEQQLVEALRRQDPGAVQGMVAAYGDRLFRSACLLCGDEAEAQDLVQETLLQGVRSAHRFGGRSSVYTWLHGILLNLTRHYHRDRKRLIYDEALARQEAGAAEDNPSRLDSESASNALAAALRQLSDPHREVLILRFYEELKIHEIADRLGISKGTVKSRLHYAIAEMQRRLPGELNLFGPCGTEEKALR
jgi:RNA polymerase sigma-70 factor (ECF subfamily)